MTNWDILHLISILVAIYVFIMMVQRFIRDNSKVKKKEVKEGGI